jgi:hypothetical protein
MIGVKKKNNKKKKNKKKILEDNKVINNANETIKMKSNGTNFKNFTRIQRII